MVVVVKNLAANTKDERCRFDLWVKEGPLEEGLAIHFSILA